MELSEEISRTYGMQQAFSHQVAESTLRLVGSEGLEEAEDLRQHRMTLWAVWAGDSQIRLRRSWETTENAKTMCLLNFYQRIQSSLREHMLGGSRGQIQHHIGT